MMEKGNQPALVKQIAVKSGTCHTYLVQIGLLFYEMYFRKDVPSENYCGVNSQIIWLFALRYFVYMTMHFSQNICYLD